MKPALVYLGVLAGGGAAGAVGMGAYNALVVGVPVEEVVVEAEVGEEQAPEDEGASETGAGELEAAAEATPTPSEVALEAASGASAGASATEPVVSSAEPPPSESGPNGPPDADSLAQVALNYQRLARIFSAMQPEEAAAVLEQLDDSQLEGILLAMQGRNAAPILAEMEPVRAAALSRRVLEGGP